MLFVDKEKCAGCGLCVEACPQQAIRMQDGTALIDQGRCAVCGTCLATCDNNAIYEVEVLDPVAVAAATRRQTETPAQFSRNGAFLEGAKRPTLVRVLAAAAPILLEGLYSMLNQRTTAGMTRGNWWGQRNCGRGRGCRRRRKW